MKSQATLDEDSRRQFKRDVTNVDSLAAEMAAFTNSEGGVIYLGVADERLLPYRGLGSGIKRALEDWPEIDFVDDRDAKLSAREVAEAMGITSRAVEKQISKLRDENRIRRIGPAKGGHWEVVE